MNIYSDIDLRKYSSLIRLLELFERLSFHFLSDSFKCNFDSAGSSPVLQGRNSAMIDPSGGLVDSSHVDLSHELDLRRLLRVVLSADEFQFINSFIGAND